MCMAVNPAREDICQTEWGEPWVSRGLNGRLYHIGPKAPQRGGHRCHKRAFCKTSIPTCMSCGETGSIRGRGIQITNTMTDF